MDRLDPDSDYAYDATNRPLSDHDEQDAADTPETPVMLLCAWCTTVLREGTLPASHGICQSCSAAQREDVTPRHLIERFAVDSSNLKSIGYERGQCVVEFTTGHLYAYEMSPADFEAFAAAESKGRYFNSVIKGKFVGDKLTGQCSQCQVSPAVIVVACPGCGGVVRAVDKIHKEGQ